MYLAFVSIIQQSLAGFGLTSVKPVRNYLLSAKMWRFNNFIDSSELQKSE